MVQWKQAAVCKDVIVEARSGSSGRTNIASRKRDRPRTALLLVAFSLKCQVLLMQVGPFHSTATKPAVQASGEVAFLGAIGRRQLFKSAVGVTSSLGLWQVSSKEAHAFRVDRIMNAKAKYVPKIRTLYQRLEGLRDDLLLEVELQTGKRVTFQARPAEWFRGIPGQLQGPEFVGTVTLAGGRDGFGCEEYEGVAKGRVVLVPRGRCTFAEKVRIAKSQGARSVIVFDEMMTSASLEDQGKQGVTAARGAALSGSLTPIERGITIMQSEPNKQAPDLDAVMMSRLNGTFIKQAMLSGEKAQIVSARRVDQNGFDAFIEKDLKKMLKLMNEYSLSQRISKDDLQDPILTTLKADTEHFEKAVRSKDDDEIQRAFTSWLGHLDSYGKFIPTEEF